MSQNKNTIGEMQKDIKEIKILVNKKEPKSRKLFLGILGFLVFLGMASGIGLSFGKGWGLGIGLGVQSHPSSDQKGKEPALEAISSYNFLIKKDTIYHKGKNISLKEFSQALESAGKEKETVEISIEAVSTTSSFKSRVDDILAKYDIAPSITILRPDKQ